MDYSFIQKSLVIKLKKCFVQKLDKKLILFKNKDLKNKILIKGGIFRGRKPPRPNYG